jgi:hypothetical protein
MFILAAAAGALVPQRASAQLIVWQSGFQTIPIDAFQAVTHLGIECSPGGEWGDFVYASNRRGQIRRVDSSDAVTTFASGLPYHGGMAFGPGPGGGFATFLYVAAGYRVNRVDPAGSVSIFAIPPGGIKNPTDVEFDPTGVYGNDLFVTNQFVGPLRKVDTLGAFTTFSLHDTNYVKFGPGGAWGTGLYATGFDGTPQAGIATIDPSGVATPFAVFGSSAYGFDWASGTGFGGDLFVTEQGDDPVADGAIYRVTSDGVVRLFATVPFAGDVAFCNGALYVAADGIYKVVPFTPVPAFHPIGWAILAIVLTATALRFFRDAPEWRPFSI